MKPYYSLSDFPDRKNAGKEFHRPMPQMRHHASVYLKSQRTISLLLRRM